MRLPSTLNALHTRRITHRSGKRSAMSADEPERKRTCGEQRDLKFSGNYLFPALIRPPVMPPPVVPVSTVHTNAGQACTNLPCVLKRALRLLCIGVFAKALVDEVIFSPRRAADILGCSRLRIGVKKGIKTAQFTVLPTEKGNTMKAHKIAVIAGDGIGKEVMPEG